MHSLSSRRRIAAIIALSGLLALGLTAWSCESGADGAGASSEDEAAEQSPESTVQPEDRLVLVYELNLDDAIQTRLHRTGDDIREQLDGETIVGPIDIEDGPDGAFLRIEVEDPADVDAVSEGVAGVVPDDFDTIEGRETVRAGFSAETLEEARDLALEQAVDTLEERIDALDLGETSVTPENSDRIVVELPEVDEEELDLVRDILRPVGMLSFRLVDDAGTNEFFGQFRTELPDGFELRAIDGGYLSVTHGDRELLQQFFSERTPPDRRIGYQRHVVYEDEDPQLIDEDRSYWMSYLLHDDALLTGEHLQDARVAIDEQFNRPYVSITFDSWGTDKFAEVTTEYVDRRFAIMIDDEVHSAPVINEPITEGRAMLDPGVSDSFTETQQQAQDLVIVLRHGVLPAPLELISERLKTTSADDDPSSIR